MHPKLCLAGHQERMVKANQTGSLCWVESDAGLDCVCSWSAPQAALPASTDMAV